MALTPLQIYRMVAAEFVGQTDGDVDGWLELTKPLVSRKQFGALYNQALALRTAHRMKMAGVGLDPTEDMLGDIGGIGIGNLMRAGSVTEGGVSVSFGSGAGAYASKDAELSMTEYGVQYLTLRLQCIVPIRSAGEPIGRV